MNVEAGQLVVYDPGYKQEIGRVNKALPLYGITRETLPHAQIWITFTRSMSGTQESMFVILITLMR